MTLTLLLAEDDRIVRTTTRDALQEAGFVVTACPDGHSADREFASLQHDIVLTDVRLPGVDGISLFRRIRARCPETVVVLMTAFADARDAASVMREGASDYIVKPFEIDELIMRLLRLKEELLFRRAAVTIPARAVPGTLIVGSSPVTQRLVDRLRAASSSDVGVLLLGETGTGKELAARFVHGHSARHDKPLVTVNCAAIPESLFESELFGHVKGAFTGADRRRVGRFESADGGTLFLDEVGELPLTSQAKLLRVLETGTFEPVGSDRTHRADARIIAATNRDLGSMMASGQFRKDLYFRLGVVDITITPLRERRGDIPELTQVFLQAMAKRTGRPVPFLDASATAALAAYDFPGNVRELMHALERAAALSAGGTIRLEHLPDAIRGGREVEGGDPASFETLESATSRFEQEYVRRVLESVGGHKTRAAEMLGISRKSLWQRLREVPDRDDTDSKD